MIENGQIVAVRHHHDGRDHVVGVVGRSGNRRPNQFSVLDKARGYVCFGRSNWNREGTLNPLRPGMHVELLE